MNPAVLLLVVGPLALGMPRGIAMEMALDQLRIRDRQRCLAAEQRARVRVDPAAQTLWWPFATWPEPVQEDSRRCPEVNP